MTDSRILELFKEKSLVYVCAPMVRYSKLAFRTLVRRYNCHLCFTPMILANSFICSSKARENEFVTNSGDNPLVVQFAAKDPHEFVTAAEMVANYSDGVDLNCGCPQSWAMREGYGAHLLSKPHLIRDIVLQVRNRITQSYTVSVKLRISEDLRHTIELCRMLEKAGISFLTVHGRTPRQKSHPVNVNALCEIKSSIQVPLIANGDVKTTEIARDLQEKTGCDGVMAARGILTNPAMFAGYPVTPLKCVEDWIAISAETSMPFQCFHHHLVFMLEKVLPKPKRLIFNVLKKQNDVLEFLEECGISCNRKILELSSFSITQCDFNKDENQGKYFSTIVNESVEDADEYIGLCNLYENSLID